MSDLQETTCCGLYEFSGLSNNRPDGGFLRSIVTEMIDENDFIPAFVLFTDINKKSKGHNLMKDIVERGLGTITRTGARRNPNTGNYIRAWIWGVNKGEVKKYAKSKGIKRN